ncbi:MAG: response regulator, partial [Betaproteobacteria bacterium]
MIRALLIEDSEEDAQLILATLAAGGFSVVSKRVETAEQMRSALQAEDWSVVLSDFNLPSFSAIEALGILRNLGSRVPMIVVTGALGEESAAGIIKAGATDLVTKQGLHRLVPVVERNLRELDSVRQYQAALAALDESEARFKAIAANLPGVVFQSLLYDDGSA